MFQWIFNAIHVSRGPVIRSIWTASIAAVLFQLAPAIAYGDDTPNRPDRDLIQQLAMQVQELQARVKDLEGKLSESGAPALASEPPVAMAPSSLREAWIARSDVSQPAVGVPAASTAAAPSAPPRPVPQESSGGSGPSVKLRLFGDLGYHATDGKGETNSFYLGSADMS
jgi:hypothetical protein